MHCEGCGYEVERPDLSCILISLLALFPRIKKLEIYTKVGVSGLFKVGLQPAEWGRLGGMGRGWKGRNTCEDVASLRACVA